MSAVRDAMRRERCRKLDKQFNGSEYIAKYAIIKGENAKYANSKDPAILAEIELRTLYYSMLDTYYSKKSFSLSLSTPSKKSASFWKRVVEKREASGVPAEDFLKAQFEFFSKNFKCPPALPCLVTDAAVARAQAFTGIIGNVVAGAKEVQMDRADLLRYYDEQIRSICKAQKIDKSTFYTNFVMTGSYDIPDFYLSICPTWKALNK